MTFMTSHGVRFSTPWRLAPMTACSIWAAAAGFYFATRSRPTPSATGLDHSEEMVKLARERAADAEVVLASAEDLPFADASFSAVAMSIVFFFLANPVAVLRECRRVLRPGGRIAVATTG